MQFSFCLCVVPQTLGLKSHSSRITPGYLISVLFCFFPLLTAETSNKKVVSHEAVLGGKLAAKTSFTLNRSGSLRAEDLTGKTLLP